MSIQKITSLPSNKMTTMKTFNQGSTNNTSNSIQTNEISKNKNEVIKAGFLNGISFKGYTKQITAHNGEQPQPELGYYGTSGSLRYPGRQAYISESDIEHAKNTKISRGYKGYDHQDYDSASVSVYYADAGEKITDEIRKRHAYIVEDTNMPEIISKEKIEKSEKLSELKEYIGILESRAEILKAKMEKAEADLAKAKENLKEAQNTYQETENRLNFAKNRYQVLVEAEKAAYKKKTLEDMQKKLDEFNDGNDKELAAISAKLKEYLNRR